MPDANAPLSNAARMRRLLALALVPGVLICFWAAGVNELLSPERLFEHRAWLRRTIDGNWPAAVAVYAAAHILAASLAAPGGLMTLAAGFLFGPTTGTLLGMGCAAAGAGLLLLAARRGLRLARLDRAAPLLERVRAGFRDAE
ncbi:MAG: hypothetical protein J0H41_11075, partial [Rhizobiales bacterium]|nr:hypothetical protein [Hyphomicrobiales bacterium]